MIWGGGQFGSFLVIFEYFRVRGLFLSFPSVAVHVFSLDACLQFLLTELSCCTYSCVWEFIYGGKPPYFGCCAAHLPGEICKASMFVDISHFHQILVHFSQSQSVLVNFSQF